MSDEDFDHPDPYDEDIPEEDSDEDPLQIVKTDLDLNFANLAKMIDTTPMSDKVPYKLKFSIPHPSNSSEFITPDVEIVHEDVTIQAARFTYDASRNILVATVPPYVQSVVVNYDRLNELLSLGHTVFPLVETSSGIDYDFTRVPTCVHFIPSKNSLKDFGAELPDDWRFFGPKRECHCVSEQMNASYKYPLPCSSPVLQTVCPAYEGYQWFEVACVNSSTDPNSSVSILKSYSGERIPLWRVVLPEGYEEFSSYDQALAAAANLVGESIEVLEVSSHQMQPYFDRVVADA